LDDLPGVGQNGGIGLEAGAGSLAGFELAVEEEGGIGELFPREAEGGAKEDLGRPAAGQGQPGPCLFGGAVAGQEFESFLDEGLRDPSGMRLDWSEVNALVVGGVQSAGFFFGA
jgi:hypothetical protein